MFCVVNLRLSNSEGRIPPRQVNNISNNSNNSNNNNNNNNNDNDNDNDNNNSLILRWLNPALNIPAQELPF